MVCWRRFRNDCGGWMDVNLSSITELLVAGGLGSAFGSIVTAIVQVRGKKGESRASAADLIATAAGGFVDRVSRANEKLEAENVQLREALVRIADAVDMVAEEVVGKAHPAYRSMKSATSAARLAIR